MASRPRFINFENKRVDKPIHLKLFQTEINEY